MAETTLIPFPVVEENGTLQKKLREQAERIRLLEIEVGRLTSEVRHLRKLAGEID